MKSVLEKMALDEVGDAKAGEEPSSKPRTCWSRPSMPEGDSNYRLLQLPMNDGVDERGYPLIFLAEVVLFSVLGERF